MLPLLVQDGITSPYIVGLENIAHALGFQHSTDADRKRAYRALREFRIPYQKKSGRVCVLVEHIRRFRKDMVVGRKALADCFGVSERTMTEILKAFPKIPVHNKGRKSPYANRLDLLCWWSNHLSYISSLKQ